MINIWVILIISLLYMVGLFLIATFTEKRNIKISPIVYTLSLAVYCTSWTFYGSVGKAATSGLIFLTIYLGPTLAIILWWIILRRMVRIKNTYKITSLADLISIRYDKSRGIAVIVTLITFAGSIPYFAVQIKSILSTFEVIAKPGSAGSFLSSNSFGLFIVILLILFTILFGVRKLAPTEHHKGMVMMFAVESIVKLLSFLAVGIITTFVFFDGFDQIFNFLPQESLQTLFRVSEENSNPYITWMSWLFLSMTAIQFLPRQFHLAVVENEDEKHIRTAMWLLPLYLFLITIFVIPIAGAGILSGLPIEKADTFVLDLPIIQNNPALALLVFIGGFSAATSMIMVSTMTISTMVSNHLILPFTKNNTISIIIKKRILQVRWLVVVLVIFMGFFFQKLIGDSQILVNIGIISFAAIAQFAPTIIGGLFWKRGNKAGAYLGLISGCLIWIFTMVYPILANAGWLSAQILNNGLFGISFLKPEQLFGFSGLDPISHTLFWSMFFNISLYFLGSILFQQNISEQFIAEDIFSILTSKSAQSLSPQKEHFLLSEKIRVVEIFLNEYLNPKETKIKIQKCLELCQIENKKKISITELVEFHHEVEKVLASVIGAAAAREAFQNTIQLSNSETTEISQVYSEILTKLKIPITEIKRKIEYYQEREELLIAHGKEIKQKSQERDQLLKAKQETEQALKQSETDFIRFFESVPIGLFRSTPSGQLININETFVHLLGYANKNEVLQTNALDLYVNPNDRQKWQEIIQNLDKDYETIVLLKRKDGSTFWAELKYKAFSNLKSEVQFYDGTVEDISEKIQHDKEQTAKFEISEALQHSETPENMIPVFLEKTLKLLPANSALMSFVESSEIDWVLCTENAFSTQILTTSKFFDLRTRRELTNINENKIYQRNYQEHILFDTLGFLDVDFLAGIPLGFEEGKIGVAWIGRKERFSEDDIRLLGIISEIVQSNIHQAILHKQTQKRLENVQALHKIDLAIASSLDLRLTFDVLLSQVIEQLNVDAADILLYDPSIRSLEYAAGKGFFSDVLKSTFINLNEGYAGIAASNRNIISVPDLREDTGGLPRDTILDKEHFITYFGVPLIAKGQVQGVLEIFNRSKLSPDNEWTNYLETLAGQAAIAIENALLFEDLQNTNRNLFQAYETTLEGWARALDLRDKETEGHTQRVTEMSIKLAKKYGVSKDSLEHIRRGALLHDIGKMGIPDKILLKPGPLDEEEWIIMKKHPVYALRLLAPIPFLENALDIPYCHHEKWDGTGYPRQLEGKEIPIAARIFSIIDVWDALCSNRPYRPAWTKEKALSYISEQSGKHFDPKIVQAFIQLYPEKF
ncbi:MAG: HD domain-containing protein [Anaerolineaceae bacterium]|nr:HD domain-containing protein [Anaerolineaceae bacterium]